MKPLDDLKTWHIEDLGPRADGTHKAKVYGGVTLEGTRMIAACPDIEDARTIVDLATRSELVASVSPTSNEDLHDALRQFEIKIEEVARRLEEGELTDTVEVSKHLRADLIEFRDRMIELTDLPD